MNVSQDYTQADHAARGVDHYAEMKFRILMDRIPRGTPLKILNVGCGAGHATEWLAERGHVVHAIDPDADAIRMGAERIQNGGIDDPRIVLKQASLEDYVSADRYDAVFALDVLEHIADDPGALAKMHSLLKPGGLIFAAVPAMPSLFGHHDVMLGHYRRYTATTLRQRVLPWFEVIYLRYFGMSLVPVALAYSRILKRAYPIQQSHDVGVVRFVLNLLLALERQIVLPRGTSLLLIGRALKSHESQAGVEA